MNKRGEAFFTKVSIGLILFGMFVGFFTLFMSDLASDYGRTIETDYQDKFSGISSDVSAIQIEAQQIQKGSGIDSTATDLAQVQGVLSATEKQADSQTILADVINSIRDILPFHDFIYFALLAIIATIFIGAIIYGVLGRWV